VMVMFTERTLVFVFHSPHHSDFVSRFQKDSSQVELLVLFPRVGAYALQVETGACASSNHSRLLRS
jgi:hypothetical protein